MAKFLVTSGSKFEPYSYDELVKPLMQATEAHKQTQEVYDELAANAESVGALISKDDVKAKQMYDAYSNTLDTYINDLQQNGYNISAQRGLSQLRRQYGRDITAIQNAVTRRRQLADEFRKRADSDPTFLAEMNPANQSLDRWLENPEYGYYRSASGAFLQDQTSKLAATLKDQLAARLTALGYDNQYFETATFTGATQEQVNAAKAAFMNGTGPTGDMVTDTLLDIMNNVYEGSGIGGWSNPEMSLKAKQYIANGANSALGGAPKFDTLSNKAWDLQAALTKQAYSNRSKGGGGDDDDSGNVRYARWDIGDEEYSGMKKRASRKLDNDYAYALKIKEAGGIGSDYKFTEEQLRDNQARLKALEDIKKYFSVPKDLYIANRRQSKGKNITDENAKKLADIEANYQKAITAFNGEYADLRPYDGSLSTAEYSQKTSEWLEIYNSLKESPITQMNRLRREYGGGKADANIDDILANIDQQRKERAKITRRSEANITNTANLARIYGDYLTRQKGTDYSTLVSSDNGRVNLEAANDAINASDSRWYFDPVNNKVMVSAKGQRYFFDPAIFKGTVALGSNQVSWLTDGEESGRWNVKQALNYISKNYTELSPEKIGLAMEYMWENIIKDATQQPSYQAPGTKPKFED